MRKEIKKKPRCKFSKVVVRERQIKQKNNDKSLDKIKYNMLSKIVKLNQI